MCTRCPPETFSDKFDSPSCRRCSANSVPDRAQSTCFCNPGFLFNRTTLACSPCPAGTYRDGLNVAFDTFCKRCSPNSVADRTRTTCVCNPGFLFNVSTLACSPCPDGTFREGLNSAFETSCRTCAPNSVPDETRSTCFCNPGFFYQIQTGGCAPCPPGTRRDGINRRFSRSCTPCGGFEFQPQAASTSCMPCGENGFSNRDRLSCFFCKAGETLIDGECGICPPGATTNTTFFAAAPSLLRQGSCKLCQRGLFKAEAGQQACERCAEGFTSNLGGTFCFPA